MSTLKTLEKQIGDLFKDLPALPKNIKDFLVQVWPYLALIFGVLQLFAAWGLWGLMRVANPYIEYANELNRYAGVQNIGYSSTDKMIIYSGIAILAVNAVIMLMALSPLKARAQRGWDLLFLATLINVVYGVVQIFISGQGIGSFIMSLLGTAVGLYLLFQVKDMYGSKSKPSSAPTTKK